MKEEIYVTKIKRLFDEEIIFLRNRVDIFSEDKVEWLKDRFDYISYKVMYFMKVLLWKIK